MARLEDTYPTQVRAICTDHMGNQTHFVQSEDGKRYILPGIVDYSQHQDNKYANKTKKRYTNLMTIKAWAIKNGLDIYVDKKYPVIYTSHK